MTFLRRQKNIYGLAIDEKISLGEEEEKADIRRRDNKTWKYDEDIEFYVNSKGIMSVPGSNCIRGAISEGEVIRLLKFSEFIYGKGNNDLKEDILQTLKSLHLVYPQRLGGKGSDRFLKTDERKYSISKI